ncbi:hydrophobin, partial [Melanogaster broomeanus]
TKPASQCSTGPVQCCNSVATTNSASLTTLFASLGIPLSSVEFPVGLTCTAIPIVGPGSGASCNSQAVCCKNNDFNGVVAIGCTAVDINL